VRFTAPAFPAAGAMPHGAWQTGLREPKTTTKMSSSMPVKATCFQSTPSASPRRQPRDRESQSVVSRGSTILTRGLGLASVSSRGAAWDTLCAPGDARTGSSFACRNYLLPACPLACLLSCRRRLRRRRRHWALDGPGHDGPRGSPRLRRGHAAHVFLSCAR